MKTLDYPSRSQERSDRPVTSAIRKVCICGVSIDAVTMRDVVDRVERAVDRRAPFAISVVNVAKLVNLRRDPALRESVESGDVCLADGAPIVWLARLTGRPLPERVTGVDLMFELFKLADRKRLGVFLLGAKREVLDRVTDICARDHPNMVIAGARDGYFTEDEEPGVADEIRATGADIMLVAMSSPKKEIFMKRWNSHMGVPVCHGVGGSFDVMAGVTRRAPRWMQRCGMEWSYRVLQEPRRMWKRYLITNTIFVGLAIRELIRRPRLQGE